MRSRYRKHPIGCSLLLNPAPRLRASRSAKESTTPRDDKPPTLDQTHSLKSATNNRRHSSELNRPTHMDHLRRSPTVQRGRRDRICPRRRHRLPRPRPLPHRRATIPRRSGLSHPIPEQLHRDLTVRRGTPHLGTSQRSSRHQTQHRRSFGRNVQQRQIHHRHPQRLPTRTTRTSVTNSTAQASVTR